MTFLRLALSVAATVCVLEAAESSERDYAAEARELAANARVSAVAANSAAQVSQVHSEAHTRLMVLLAEQGAEMIRQSKAVQNEVAKATSFNQESSRNICVGIYVCTAALFFAILVGCAWLRAKPR